MVVYGQIDCAEVWRILIVAKKIEMYIINITFSIDRIL